MHATQTRYKRFATSEELATSFHTFIRWCGKFLSPLSVINIQSSENGKGESFEGRRRKAEAEDEEEEEAEEAEEGKRSKNNDNRFFNNFILYFTLITKRLKKERRKVWRKVVWKEISNIRWDVKTGKLRESAHFSLTRNDCVSTVSVSEIITGNLQLKQTSHEKQVYNFPQEKHSLS